MGFSSRASTPSRAPHSPISEQEETPETDNNNYKSQEYVEYEEPSIHPDLLEKMSKYYNQNNDETGSISSTNSYAELDTDGETITLSDNKYTDTETIEAPPRKKFKSNHSPAMFCNLLSSNFFYHQSKTINLPKNIPKIKNIPFKSISNVKFHNNPQFLTNLSSYAPSRSM